MRFVGSGPTSLTLHDVAGDGQVLVSVDAERRGVIARAPDDPVEREISWFDRAGLADLSPDGRQVLFGDRLGVYLRDTAGSPAARLGDGFANSLSADGRWAVVTRHDVDGIVLLPTGPGQPREVRSAGITTYETAWLLPDDETLVFNGHEAGRPMRAYRMPLSGGPRHPITPEGTYGVGLAAASRLLVTTGSGAASLYPVDGGPPRLVPGAQPGDRPAGWSADGGALWVFRRGELPVPVDHIDLATGRRTPWRRLQPSDPAGVVFVSAVRVAADGGAYAYSYRRIMSDLVLVTGLR
jgi:hypothetical protein